MTTIDTTGLRTRAQSTAKAGGDIHIAPGSFLATNRTRRARRSTRRTRAGQGARGADQDRARHV